MRVGGVVDSSRDARVVGAPAGPGLGLPVGPEHGTDEGATEGRDEGDRDALQARQQGGPESDLGRVVCHERLAPPTSARLSSTLRTGGTSTAASSTATGRSGTCRLRSRRRCSRPQVGGRRGSRRAARFRLRHRPAHPRAGTGAGCRPSHGAAMPVFASFTTCGRLTLRSSAVC